MALHWLPEWIGRFAVGISIVAEGKHSPQATYSTSRGRVLTHYRHTITLGWSSLRRLPESGLLARALYFSLGHFSRLTRLRIQRHIYSRTTPLPKIGSDSFNKISVRHPLALAVTLFVEGHPSVY